MVSAEKFKWKATRVLSEDAQALLTDGCGQGLAIPNVRAVPRV